LPLTRHYPPPRIPAPRAEETIFRELSTSSSLIGVLKVARGFFAAHSRFTNETIANCSWLKP